MNKNKNLYRIIILALLTGAITFTLWQSKSLDVESITRQINSFGPHAWLAFMLVYALGTVLFFPGSLLTLAGGAMFGPVMGTFYNLTAATIGASLAFLIARYLASDWVEAKTGGRLKQLKDGVEHEGWRFVAFVRLVPLFPFNLLNYALGLTRIRFSHYLIATYACMLPGAIAYTYLGYAGREAIAGGESLIQKAMLALALLAIVAFVPRIIACFRPGSSITISELQQKLLAKDKLVLIDLRSEEDFHSVSGHIKNAINIPLEAIEADLSPLSPYHELSIAFICTTDKQSKKAAQLLSGQNFKNIHVVSGGMKKWQEKNLPVEC